MKIGSIVLSFVIGLPLALPAGAAEEPAAPSAHTVASFYSGMLDLHLAERGRDDLTETHAKYLDDMLESLELAKNWVKLTPGQRTQIREDLYRRRLAFEKAMRGENASRGIFDAELECVRLCQLLHPIGQQEAVASRRGCYDDHCHPATESSP